MKNMRKIMMIVGALLIVANALWILLEGKALIFSSYPASSLEDLSGVWGRIVFGMPSMLWGRLIYVWSILAIANLILVLGLNFKEKSEPYVAPLVLVLSLTSVTVGGGFFIGMILIVTSSLSAIEKKPLRETFLGKLFRAVRLDSSLYEKIGQSTDTLRNAAYIVVFLNILTGLGNGIYVLSAQKIADPIYATLGRAMLFGGDIPVDIVGWGGVLSTYVGLAIAKWLVFSAITYFCLTRLTGTSMGFRKVGLLISFAYSPIAMQVFLPLVFFNQPILTSTWPIAFFLISNIWVGIALVVAISKSGNISTANAFGVTILASSIYYAINNVLIVPNFPTLGIRFQIQPVAVTEIILTAGVLLGLFFGAFARHEGQSS
jgi:hypothetical protein